MYDCLSTLLLSGPWETYLPILCKISYHQNQIVIILPSPVSETESNIFLFSEVSSSFILAADPGILGRGSKCPGVGTGLLEQYGILRAWK